MGKCEVCLFQERRKLSRGVDDEGMKGKGSVESETVRVVVTVTLQKKVNAFAHVYAVMPCLDIHNYFSFPLRLGFHDK